MRGLAEFCVYKQPAAVKLMLPAAIRKKIFSAASIYGICGTEAEIFGKIP